MHQALAALHNLARRRRGQAKLTHWIANRLGIRPCRVVVGEASHNSCHIALSKASLPSKSRQDLTRKVQARLKRRLATLRVVSSFAIAMEFILSWAKAGSDVATRSRCLLRPGVSKFLLPLYHSQVLARKQALVRAGAAGDTAFLSPAQALVGMQQGDVSGRRGHGGWKRSPIAGVPRINQPRGTLAGRRNTHKMSNPATLLLRSIRGPYSTPGSIRSTRDASHEQALNGPKGRI
jgi:hypothetical protein